MEKNDFLIFIAVLLICFIGVAFIYSTITNPTPEGDKFNAYRLARWHSVYAYPIANFIILLFGCLLNYLADEMEEYLISGVSIFICILLAIVLPFIGIFLLKGLGFLFFIFGDPPWIPILIVFVINLFISIEIHPEIFGIFFLDTLLLAAVLSFISLVFAVGFLCTFEMRFGFSFLFMLISTAFMAVGLRYFLWRYED